MSDETDHDPRTAFEHSIHGRVGSLEDSRRTWRWIVGLGAPAIIALVIYAADAIKTSGEAKATMDAIQRTLSTLDLDIRELRLKILKLSGTDPDDSATAIVQK